MRIVFGKKRSRHKVRFEANPIEDGHFIHVTFYEAPKGSEPERHKYSYWIIENQLPRFRELMARQGLTVESED
jgi:hypothetical protein